MNPQPTAYKAVAHPLCYRGSFASTVVLSLRKKGCLFVSLAAVDADGTPAHLRLAEREGFDPPCPSGLRFSRPTHLPILPPLQMACQSGLEPETPALTVQCTAIVLLANKFW